MRKALQAISEVMFRDWRIALSFLPIAERTFKCLNSGCRFIKIYLLAEVGA
jgi:hypothetical protein